MTGGRIMSKIVNITSKEDKDQKLQDIANSLEELKDVMAEVIEAYEEENADSRKMDTLTEALDALEDAYEAVNDVLAGGNLIMQYKVLKIEEDMDFGCEERQPGEALMSVVLVEDENRNETSLRHDDGLLYERDINEGDFVTMDGQHQLWKL